MQMRLPDSGSLIASVLSGLGEAATRGALLAYLRGDPAWRRPFQWSAM